MCVLFFVHFILHFSFCITKLLFLFVVDLVLAEDVPLTGTKRSYYIMKIKVVFIVLSFLSSIIKNKRINPAEYLKERYSEEILKIYKKLIDTSR